MNFLANEPLRTALPLPHLTLLCKAWYGWCTTWTLAEFGPWGKADFVLKVVSLWDRLLPTVTVYVFVFLLCPGGSLYNKVTMDRAMSHFMVLLWLQFQISQLYPILSSSVHPPQWKKSVCGPKVLKLLGTR